jgi:hypothetical protein
VVTIHPEVIAAIDARLEQNGELTVVCVDRAFGERVRASVGQAYRDRIQVVLAGDSEAIATLDPSTPVLLTRAARQQLPDAGFRLVTALSPSFSPQSMRDIATELVRFNMEAART